MTRAARHADRRTKASRKARKAQASGGIVRTHSSKGQRGRMPAKIDENRVCFLDLPRELRTPIYEYALRPANGRSIPLSLGAQLKITNELAFGLLSTCRIVRKEATTVLYAQNTFRIDVIPASDSAPPPIAQIRQERIETENDHRVYKDKELENWWREESVIPNLTRALNSIVPARLVSIRSFVFAFHARKLKSAHCYESYDFSRTPELTVNVEFFKRQQPRYLIALDRAEGFQHVWTDKGSALSIRSYLADSIKSRSLSALSRKDVKDFALWISYQCEKSLSRYYLIDV